MKNISSKLFTLMSLIAVAAHAQYKGHGAESVSAAQLKKFAAKPLDSASQLKIQRRMDLHRTSAGKLDDQGENLYFNWNVTGVSQVWRLHDPNTFPSQLTSGEDRTNFIDVTPDGKSVILSRDTAGDEYPGLYLQSSQGGPLKTIYKKPKVQALAEHLTPDGRYLYFRANDKKPEDYTIYRYEFSSGKTEEIFSGEGYWELSDRLDDTLLLSKWRGNTMVEVFTFDEKTKKLTPLFGQGEDQEYQVRFGRTSSEVIVLTNKFEDFRRLYRHNGKVFIALTPPANKDIASFQIDAQRKRIVLGWNDQGYSRLTAHDLKTFEELKLPEFKNAMQVWAGSFSNNGRYMTIGAEYATQPRSLLVYDWDRKKTTTWMIPSTPEVDTTKFTSRTLEYYSAQDGTQIPMFVARPKQCEDKVCPVIVDFHGGPEGQSSPFFDPVGELYLEEGFILVEPNVRGSDGYGKKWLDADNRGDRLKVISDIRDCARFIKANWKKNGQSPKVGVMGGSYGGYSTLVAMTMFAGDYDVGVASVGMSNLVTFLKNTAPYRRVLRESEYGYLAKDMEALKKLSPVTYLSRAKGPLMILQGASDPRVPAGEAIQMYESWTKKNLPAELIIFGDEGHGIAKRQNRVLATGHTLRFFKTYLKGEK